MNPKNRYELINAISKVSFYVDDLRLFLDTHPEDCAAIAEYNKAAAAKRELVKDYVEQYGPFNSYSLNLDMNDWKWVAYPWPWEGVCD